MHISLINPRRARRLVLALGLGLFGLAGSGAASALAQDTNLRPGAVFSMTNNPVANTITPFERSSDGTLTQREDVPTGGMGTGTPEDSANGLILANVSGESSPTNFRGTAKFLLAANGGSDSITVFRNEPDGLVQADVENSNGVRPISITVNRGVVYVLNAGTPMCTGLGPQPNITGFRLDAQGQLTPIPGSTRPLSGIPNSGCTQVAFDKTGKVVFVEEQQADVITSYTRNNDGTLSGPTPQQTTGNGPFGLNFTQRNQLLTTENFGAAPAQGGLASYSIDERTGLLTAASPTVRNGQSDTCWVTITDDNKLAFTSSFGDDGGISSYRVEPDGNLVLLDAQAATVGSGSSDVTLSRDSKYLYVKNSLEGTVTSFRVEDDGALVQIDEDRDTSVTGSIGIAGQ